jgi:hypothetical protein
MAWKSGFFSEPVDERLLWRASPSSLNHRLFFGILKGATWFHVKPFPALQGRAVAD